MKASSSSGGLALETLRFGETCSLFSREGSKPAALNRVLRKDRFRAFSNDWASEITPLGPVLASKTVDGTVYEAVRDTILGDEESLSEESE